MARFNATDLFILTYWGISAGLAWIACSEDKKNYPARDAAPTIGSILVLGLAILWHGLRLWAPQLDSFRGGLPRSVQWVLLFLPILAFWGVGVFYLRLAFENRPPIVMPKVPQRTVRFMALCFGAVSGLTALYALMWTMIGLGTLLSRIAR